MDVPFVTRSSIESEANWDLETLVAHKAPHRGRGTRMPRSSRKVRDWRVTCEIPLGTEALSRELQILPRLMERLIRESAAAGWLLLTDPKPHSWYDIDTDRETATARAPAIFVGKARVYNSAFTGPLKAAYAKLEPGGSVLVQ